MYFANIKKESNIKDDSISIKDKLLLLCDDIFRLKMITEKSNFEFINLKDVYVYKEYNFFILILYMLFINTIAGFIIFQLMGVRNIFFDQHIEMLFVLWYTIPGGLISIGIILILEFDIKTRLNRKKIAEIIEGSYSFRIKKEKLEKILGEKFVICKIEYDKYRYKVLNLYLGNQRLVYSISYCHDDMFNEMNFDEFKEKEFNKLKREKEELTDLLKKEDISISNVLEQVNKILD